MNNVTSASEKSTHPLSVSRAIHDFAASKNITCVQLAVLTSLANFRNEMGIAWPSVATIARQACCCERTTQRALKALVEKGLIKVLVPATPRESAVYQIFLPPVAERPTPLPATPQGSIPVETEVHPVRPKEQKKEIKNTPADAQARARRAQDVPEIRAPLPTAALTRRERSEQNRQKHAEKRSEPKKATKVPERPKTLPLPLSREEQVKMAEALKAWRLSGFKGEWSDHATK